MGGISFEMEKYLKAVQPEMAAKAERILELNTAHTAIAAISGLMQSDPDKAGRYTKILYHQAELMAGLDVENPAEYSEMIFELLTI